MNQLVKEDYIIVSSGEDKRTKDLELTLKGIKLEEKLSSIQINEIREVIKDANEEDINGFKKILYSIIDTNARIKFDKINK